MYSLSMQTHAGTYSRLKEASSALGSESMEARSIQTYRLHTQQPEINTSSKMNDQPNTNKSAKRIIESLFVDSYSYFFK
ncbi:hypothetical protein TIFTF001_039586 [Ficus carica]|uniref:Uncharacterized protein n=1 Tax=Ficus carica TaxID=3494 RepID=A0AA88EJQ1_FICCA|nr:hypothetical protein TIFTF001_039562 [Ficus carica]GMN70529.1 hypothetical protein TIFTF001_039574 [Ficus carica]GMN70537.1 hypothetical protein TIFTF001_039582 [Ficus carica]GMN70544.1 hypothetical protein TIFTF001_039586 [Ficus carica]